MVYKPSDACMGHNLLMASKYCFQGTYPINTCIDMYDYSLLWRSWKYTIFFATVGVPRMVSLEPLTSRGAVRVTWSPPADLCGLTNPQYTIQYGRTTSSPTTHPSTPFSLPLTITILEVGQQYFVRVPVHTQSGSGTFSSWQLVTTYGGVSNSTVSS